MKNEYENAAQEADASDMDTPVKAKESVQDDPFEFDTSEPASRVAERSKPVIEAPKAMSFKETFASQRKAGAKTFEWNGKKYTTDIAAKKPAVAKVEAKAEVKVDNSIPWTDPKATVVAPKAEPKRERSIYDGSIADTGPAAVKALYTKMTTPSDRKVTPIQTGGGKSVVDTSMQVGMGKPKSDSVQMARRDQ